jgi:hypothetical protein
MDYKLKYEKYKNKNNKLINKINLFIINLKKTNASYFNNIENQNLNFITNDIIQYIPFSLKNETTLL